MMTRTTTIITKRKHLREGNQKKKKKKRLGKKAKKIEEMEDNKLNLLEHKITKSVI